MEPSVNLYALSKIWMKILRSSGLCKHKLQFLAELVCLQWNLCVSLNVMKQKLYQIIAL